MRKFLTIVGLFVFCFALNSMVFGQQNRAAQFGPQTKSIVQIARAEAFSDGNGAWLHWQTEIESGNLGFNIYKITGKEIVRVNPNMIGGALLSSSDEITYGKEYSFFDTDGTSGDRYFIESYGTNGGRKNLVEITTQYIADLTRVAGNSSAFLQDAARTAQPDFLENDLQLPIELQEITNGAARPTSDPAVQQWVANQPGVKIGVRKNGIYRVTRTELENAGFNVNGDQNLWQLYLDGVQQAIKVGANGDFIEFYGRTVETTLTNTRIYYLLNGTTGGKRIEDKVISPFAGNVVGKTYDNSFKKSERLYYINDYLNGDDENFFGSVITAANTNINFDLSAVDLRTGVTPFTIILAGLTVNPHLVEVTLNGTVLGQMSWNGKTVKTQAFSIPYQLLQNGSNTVSLRSLNASGDVSIFQSVKVDFPRAYVAQQDELAFYTNNRKVSNVTGFTTANVRLFDVTFPDTPRLITNVPALPNNGGFDLRIPANRAFIMYAVEDSKVLPAATIVRNFPSTLSTPANNADFIIISHRDLLTQANDWAAYRATEGMNVKVVDVEDIFDEFSYGLMSSNAIRNFLQYAKNNWQTQPNYVMIMGDATYDPKNYLGSGYLNQVPTQMVDTVYTETGSDEALADFNNDGLAELAVGRISSRTPQEATDIFNKTVQFEANLATAFDRGFMFVSDLPNGYDFQGVSNRLRGELPPTANSLMVFRGDADSRTQVINGWNSGKYLVNYTGHGATGIWAASSFFTSADIPPMTNTNYTIFTALTCLNGYFIDPNFSSLSELAVKTPNKAAVASWSSTGLTTPDIQEIMGRRFFNRLGAGTIPRMGDLIRDAKTQIPGGRDVRLSWALLGDPTLKVRPTSAPRQQPAKDVFKSEN